MYNALSKQLTRGNCETARRLVERTDEHRGKDKNSYVYQHLVNLNHGMVTLDDFIILNFRYRHDKYQRKISKDLVINAVDLTLEKKIHLFPWDFLIEVLTLLKLTLSSFLLLTLIQ